MIKLKIAIIVSLLTCNFTINLNKIEYSVVKKEIIKEQNKIRNEYVKASFSNKKKQIELAKQLITQNLISKIFPYWYGTKWSFEGFTASPKEGTIACGYFVSTTLSHAGFKLNRYKFAQKDPKTEAQFLQIEGNMEVFEKSVSELNKYFITSKKEGLYFVGLDFHVGYLLKQNNEVYFIHSNFIGNEGVIKEKITQSKAFISKKYYIVSITENENLVKKWILNKPISTN